MESIGILQGFLHFQPLRQKLLCEETHEEIANKSYGSHKIKPSVKKYRIKPIIKIIITVNQKKHIEIAKNYKSYYETSPQDPLQRIPSHGSQGRI